MALASPVRCPLCNASTKHCLATTLKQRLPCRVCQMGQPKLGRCPYERIVAHSQRCCCPPDGGAASATYSITNSNCWHSLTPMSTLFHDHQLVTRLSHGLGCDHPGWPLDRWREKAKNMHRSTTPRKMVKKTPDNVSLPENTTEWTLHSIIKYRPCSRRYKT